MNGIGLVQNKWRASLTSHETHCVHNSMNVSCVTYFERVPLSLYFEECQKNEIYFLIVQTGTTVNVQNNIDTNLNNSHVHDLHWLLSKLSGYIFTRHYSIILFTKLTIYTSYWQDRWIWFRCINMIVWLAGSGNSPLQWDVYVSEKWHSFTGMISLGYKISLSLPLLINREWFANEIYLYL